MKIIWTPEDIVVGRRYSREGIDEVWLIGYISDNPVDDKTDCRYVSISMLDGMVTLAKTKEKFSEDLTEGGYFPIEFLNNPPKL